jgi:hypothetical protein
MEATNSSLQSSQEKVEDVIVTAKRLGKTVLHVNKFIPYLNKVLRKKAENAKETRANKRQFAHPCI